MPMIHTLGAPRIGPRRELKTALEAYWAGEIDAAALEEAGRDIRRRNRADQRAAGLSFVTVGDFSFYDHVLDMSATLGVVPERFGAAEAEVSLDTRFRMARGRAPSGAPARACAMKKWFDTNYHYIRPELEPGTRIRLASTRLLDEAAEALAEGHPVKAVLPGPVTWAWLARESAGGPTRLGCLPAVAEVYAELIGRLAGLGVNWVQLDEPVLATDLSGEWRAAFAPVYARLAGQGARLLLAAYFGPLAENFDLVRALPVDGLHLDALRGGDELERVAADWPAPKVLSAGIVDGRNVWRCDLDAARARLAPLADALGARLWLAPSCALLHVPVDLAQEEELDPELASWLAFARQKLDELALLSAALEDAGAPGVAEALARSRAALAARRTSHRTRNPDVRAAAAAVTAEMARRASPHAERAVLQRARLNLPLLPTTTIGSFPQTAEIRAARAARRRGEIDEAAYLRRIGAATKETIAKQEEIGLDVLVHGEAERNDMVEYFGEQLQGFAFTRHGWVQSYGSRCVKPPILHGDVSRPRAMTVDWTVYAQSLTPRPVKGMLTGPVTLLNWSFVRDDQPRAETCAQIALALRAEVSDLETVGIRIIQIDEAAFREGLPLRAADRAEYLRWAAEAFRLTAGVVGDATQIHSHMCYSEFNDIIDAVAGMDADVVTIESSRSDMELLDAFRDYDYPNEIGPGIWDIHSPNVPSAQEMAGLLRKAAGRIAASRLWVNPDCGLKTRGWAEVEPALRNMVAAAQALRAEMAEVSAAE
ncbi:5-methyltetrahydropteroyltriglutamate--homocysteine S-methyltransferase [Paroceanicella profunda]|uniref:5-methyltetrahydropteroyltriglutamate--homocysteine methyltransferase n=1 Tax=Paroceanicella profunda TaxID=2579971 RepID=A0A5B8FSI0_9RHOB|nr:5-methyltetrahydropteroyltriglutamate--homocysteine S-methyltransferase [Paroceanicella profunda]QDL91726.1 5-methyltetrahydropteroyltriglutamate--homocysteine S-methyltransferase [Paroceanicella profunda]